MDPTELDRLLTLAEIAVAITGFAAIVVLFKRRDTGTWRAQDADRFNGMIVHSVAATLLCLVPPGLAVFVDDPAPLWSIASVLMALQVGAHAAVVTLYVRSTGPAATLAVCGGALFVVSLQGMNVLGLAFDRGAGPYLMGVLWHLAHAAGLFANLVWVRESDVER